MITPNVLPLKSGATAPLPRFVRSAMAPLLLLLFLTPATAPAADAKEDDATAIRRVTTGMWDALGKQDLDAFRSFCSDRWTLFTAVGNRFSVERLFEIHRANIRNFQLQATNIKVNIEGDLAWVTYDAVMSGERQGQPWGGYFLMTQIHQREGNRWQCVHTHESRKPDGGP